MTSKYAEFEQAPPKRGGAFRFLHRHVTEEGLTVASGVNGPPYSGARAPGVMTPERQSALPPAPRISNGKYADGTALVLKKITTFACVFGSLTSHRA